MSMESKVYTILLHRAAVSRSEYDGLRQGWRERLTLPDCAAIRPGEWLMLCDRRNPREFIIKRVLSAEPSLWRPGSITLRFRRAPSAVVRCGCGNMYQMEVAR